MSEKYVVLYIEFEDCIKNDKSILEKYTNRVLKHNLSVENDLYPDSGFDLILPQLEEFNKNQTKLVSFGIKCSAYEFFGPPNFPNYEVVQSSYIKGLNNMIKPLPFTIHPKSSIWKYDFRLANSTGIIDMGYRGTIYGAMHNIKKNKENIMEYGNRYIQICMHNLQPFYVKIVDKIENDSIRGKGGIGSTGK